MWNAVKRILGTADEDPIAYRVPLDWFEAQLPQDLLGTGLYWIWESHRGFKGGSSSLPDERSPTALTAATASLLGSDFGDYHLETHREVTAFATAGTSVMSAVELQAALRAFAGTGGGPLVAILYQPPLGSAEVFLPRAPLPGLMTLVAAWAQRLGKPVGQLERSPGGDVLRRIFLNKQALAAGALKAFPPAE